MSTKPQGFAHPSFDDKRHKELSSKGGKAKNPNKGFGSLSEELRKKNASLASRARWAKVKQERQKTE